MINDLLSPIEVNGGAFQLPYQISSCFCRFFVADEADWELECVKCDDERRCFPHHRCCRMNSSKRFTIRKIRKAEKGDSGVAIRHFSVVCLQILQWWQFGFLSIWLNFLALCVCDLDAGHFDLFRRRWAKHKPNDKITNAGLFRPQSPNPIFHYFYRSMNKKWNV